MLQNKAYAAYANISLESFSFFCVFNAIITIQQVTTGAKIPK